MEIILNDSQSEAFKRIQDWFNDEKSKQIYFLSGYAGTGKTFLIKFIIEKFGLTPDKDVAVITPTGKSAEVLVGKEIPATTLHRLIYNPVEKIIIKEINGAEVQSKKIEFVRKTSLGSYKLLILDEFSMVSDQMIKDIKSFGIKILCCGDNAQLKPVGSKNSLIDKPDFTLTEIVRQNAENPIVRLATDIRTGKYINAKNYDSNYVQFIPRKSLSEEELKELYFSVDQIIVGRNSTKDEVNEQYRRFLGYNPQKDPLPKVGEKVISLVNSWNDYLDSEEKFTLVNGTIGTLVSETIMKNEELNLGMFYFKPNYECEYSGDAIIADCTNFKLGSWATELHQHAFLMMDGSLRLKHVLSPNLSRSDRKKFINFAKENTINERQSIDEMQVNRFEFAYAISCHKSQGSEFKTVLVYDESYIFGKEKNNWLYTAVTRAKEKLIILY